MVFGVGLLAGMLLAPYGPLFYRTPPPEPPLVTGLLVVVGPVALCWWLAALVDRSPPTGWARAALLPVAVTVGVVLLVLVRETTGWLTSQELSCELSPAGCGPLAAPGILLTLFAEPPVTPPQARRPQDIGHTGQPA